MQTSSTKKLFFSLAFLLFFFGCSAPAFCTPGHKPVPADSSAVRLLKLPELKKKELADDRDYIYDRRPPRPKTIWQQLWEWLGELFSRIFSKKVGKIGNTAFSLLDIIEYALAITAIILVIILLLKNNFRGLFYGKSAAVPLDFSESEENIHQVNFDELIAEAAERGDFRKAVRLHFLQLLKQLSDKNLIAWQLDKTNSDYLAELSKSTYGRQFGEIAYLYEYIWYGDFQVTESSYSNMVSKFKSFTTA